MCCRHPRRVWGRVLHEFGPSLNALAVWRSNTSRSPHCRFLDACCASRAACRHRTALPRPQRFAPRSERTGPRPTRNGGDEQILCGGYGGDVHPACGTPVPVNPRSRPSLSHRVRELLDVAQQKLGYLRVVTPRRAEDDELLGVGGARRYVVHDGRVVEVDAAGGTEIDADGDRSRPAVKNWGAGNMDPDSVRRHEGLMRRFRFEDRAGGAARGPFSR